MINKRNSSAKNNVVLADQVSFRIATNLEKSLMHWAFEFSVYSERSAPWDQVKKILELSGTTGYRPSHDELKSFLRASITAHRIESSLMVAEGVDPEFYVKNPLALRIKFYYKNDRKEFLEWYMIFGCSGRIHRAGFCGHGELGLKAMA